MIIIMRIDVTPDEIANVTQRIEHYGARVHPIQGSERVVLGSPIVV